jgi:1-acyl-sn-glycerol-3-phosphate acyltransferase
LYNAILIGCETKEQVIKSLLGNTGNNPSPQGGNAFSKWLGRFVLTTMGWRATGVFPSQSKYIITVAPHSSNWDFVVAIAILLASGLKISFLAKHSLFFWPFSVLLRKLGGVPVDRGSAHGVVGEMVQHFNQRDKMVLAIAPEGTRRKVKQWKVGFIHIANSANVPIVPLSLDYLNKRVNIGAAIKLSGEVEADLNTVKAFYLGVQGKNGKVS